MIKQTIVSIVLVFVLLFLYTKLAGPIPFSVTSTTTTKSDTFEVTGDGKTTIVPDIAIVNVGVVAEGSTVKEAQNSLNTRINAVSKEIKALGVADEDLETTNYSINPRYTYRGTEQRIQGYQASSTLTVKIRNIDAVNDIIDKATESGANQVGGITFDLDDKTKAQDEARKLAVAKAKEKAQSASQIAGFTLGKIINYREDFGGYQPPRRPQMLTADAAVASTQIEPGSSEIVVVVTLSYEIR